VLDPVNNRRVERRGRHRPAISDPSRGQATRKYAWCPVRGDGDEDGGRDPVLDLTRARRYIVELAWGNPGFPAHPNRSCTRAEPAFGRFTDTNGSVALGVLHASKQPVLVVRCATAPHSPGSARDAAEATA
jgi:hypothetical protein